MPIIEGLLWIMPEDGSMDDYKIKIDAAKCDPSVHPPVRLSIRSSTTIALSLDELDTLITDLQSARDYLAVKQ